MRDEEVCELTSRIMSRLIVVCLEYAYESPWLEPVGEIAQQITLKQMF